MLQFISPHPWLILNRVRLPAAPIAPALENHPVAWYIRKIKSYHLCVLRKRNVNLRNRYYLFFFLNTMDSIINLFKIGLGPSSSHTMGPMRAARQFLLNCRASRYQVTLYGSLAATGKGHMTDKAIYDVLGKEKTEILWQPEVFLPYHPNGMKFVGFDEKGIEQKSWTVYSVGGGFLSDGLHSGTEETVSPYPYGTMREILQWCDETGCSLWEYVWRFEGEKAQEHLANVWKVMKESVQRGLETEGVLPGTLALQRKAAACFLRARTWRTNLQKRGELFAYALAVAEENAASSGPIVTAPTCGSAGVLPAVLYSFWKSAEAEEPRIIRALATAGLVGLSAKENGSISGAEVGCQGEIGVACAMAAAAACQMDGGSPHQIEYAAEMGLEHHLGLTCDPVCGLVQIPCIERNAFAAARAIDAGLYAGLTDGHHRISFDKVVKTMLETGHDLPSLYKETSTGGLARDDASKPHPADGFPR